MLIHTLIEELPERLWSAKLLLKWKPRVAESFPAVAATVPYPPRDA